MSVYFIANVGRLMERDPDVDSGGGGGLPAILMETGSYLLQETGFRILLE